VTGSFLARMENARERYLYETMGSEKEVAYKSLLDEADCNKTKRIVILTYVVAGDVISIKNRVD
jgi:hypothetical protein